jgi:hypothetical protein
MKITDMPSLGAFARAHNIRRDLATVLSSIETAHDRGSDVSDHLDNVKQLAAHLLRFVKETKTKPRGGALVPAQPLQLPLDLND